MLYSLLTLCVRRFIPFLLAALSYDFSYSAQWTGLLSGFRQACLSLYNFPKRAASVHLIRGWGLHAYYISSGSPSLHSVGVLLSGHISCKGVLNVVSQQPCLYSHWQQHGFPLFRRPLVCVSYGNKVARGATRQQSLALKWLGPLYNTHV